MKWLDKDAAQKGSILEIRKDSEFAKELILLFEKLWEKNLSLTGIQAVLPT